MNIIPSIDLRQGRCVRLYKGNFDRQTDYNRDPVALAGDYEAMGFDDLHIVDLDGAKTGQQQNQDIVQKIVGNSSLTIQLGGGIRSTSQFKSWLDAGVTRVVIGTLAVSQSSLVREWIKEFGPERLVLALDVTMDATGTPRVATHAWTQTADVTLFECLDDFISAGIRHVLCTDVSRDGALTGPNLELYAQLIRDYPDLRLQASGGVRGIEDLFALSNIGAQASISGRALLDGRITPAEIATFLPAA